MEEVLQLLVNYQSLIDSHLSQLFLLVGDKNIRIISEDYALNIENRKVDIGFNLFAIIAKKYQLENLHSDILQVILNPKGKHNEGDKYLKLFLIFIKELGADINLSNYRDTVVYREKGRIDLLIEDRNTNRAIIIENKINNAIDQPRQLPEYLKYVKSKNCTCDAIVYLTLSKKKSPDTSNWTDEEKEVQALIIKINAYDETEQDLLKGWINKAEKQSTHIDALLILRQYGDLIKHLGGNVMDKQIMEKFYIEMLKKENYKTALSFKSMMDDLILYRVENIIDRFNKNPKPFESINNWHDEGAYFFKLPIEKSNLAIDIWVIPENYSFQFWDRDYKIEGVNPFVQSILEKMGVADDFFVSGNRMTKEFQFPEQEQEMFEYIQNFNNKLSEVLHFLNSTSQVLN